MMLRFLTFLAILITLSGCDQNSSTLESAQTGSKGDSGSLSAQSVASNAQLAYSHRLDLEMPATSVKLHYERARDLCLKNPQINCIMLNAALNMGSSEILFPSASLTVRLPHESIGSFEDSLFAPLPGQVTGDVILRSRSTTADDLTNSITDVERRLVQLTDYRERLTLLSTRSDARVEDLIKIQSELSTVQSQIEAIAAQKKNLNERVATETLSVEFQSQPSARNSFAPVIGAWHQGGRVLGENTGNAIKFTIGALPWLPIVAFGLFFVRLIIRRWRR